jgi:DNA-binding transcriptional LysR family regulator
LQRTTRKLSLTEAGEVYVARIRPLIEGLDAANDEASTSGRTPGGLLESAIPPSISRQPN